MNIVTKNAHTQATAPASIGVKTPVRMPPSTITSVTIPHTASPSILTRLSDWHRLALRMLVAIGIEQGRGQASSE